MGVATATVVAAVAYGVGVRRLARRGRRWPVARSAAFAAAVVAAIAAGLVGDATFSRHMVEHLLLSMVCPLLAAMGAPMTLALQAGGPATRRGLRRVLHGPVGRVLGRPVVGFVVFGAGLAAVYLTPLLEASATDDAAHLAVHVHLLGSGLVFLVPVVGVDALPRPAPFPARIFAVVLAVPFHAFLALAIWSADAPLAPDAYPSLDDQRQAAGILWASGEVLTVAVAGVVFARWYAAERRAELREVRSPAC